MSWMENANIKDLERERAMRDSYFDEWESRRKIKRCACGNAYSYDAQFESDPRCCASCGNREGSILR